MTIIKPDDLTTDQTLLFDAARTHDGDAKDFVDAVANGEIAGFHVDADDIARVRSALSGEPVESFTG